ncbi:hypothetical protein THMIRHAM_15700 [Thiomicrorhabdus immobilis]|uniref:Aminoglycoside phosphotransferase domain-containing protein n=1 Tax=Thiomicrorhabdus immobilis TaxID=2791037 RepID=A0ABN6CXR3_9GAMM|nr:aminoglycoside phosphotransferase family protein [Thiomicrorhabdus immobilis]BCN93785.1 hypothetical protein THMIRHAM_15700 [Thiomicrorhabdus immobilis]
MQHDKILQAQSPFVRFKRVELQKYQKISYSEKLPGLYEDSSSEVWLIEHLDIDGHSIEAVVKAYNRTDDITPFWKAMQILFGLDLCDSYQLAKFSYPLLSQITSLKIPEVYDCLVAEDVCALVLENIKGQTYSARDSCAMTVRQLAGFLAEMHSHPVEKIGFITEENLNEPAAHANPTDQRLLKEWQTNLTKTILSLSKDIEVSEPLLAKALTDVEKVSITKLVPLMLDLRWDQFAQQDGVLMGIYDLDAFVFAPVELDFVILEYLLTPSQLQLFEKEYQLRIAGQLPCLQGVRHVYRVLLFLMNVLGESDMEKWMAQPSYFNGKDCC